MRQTILILVLLCSACGPGVIGEPGNELTACEQYADCVSMNAGDDAELEACDTWLSACEEQYSVDGEKDD